MKKILTSRVAAALAIGTATLALAMPAHAGIGADIWNSVEATLTADTQTIVAGVLVGLFAPFVLGGAIMSMVKKGAH